MTDLVMYRGDDRSFTVTTTGLPDLTSATIVFTAKRKITDADVDAVISLTTPTEVEIISASSFRVNIPAAATVAIEKETKLFWDAQITLDGEIRTLPDASLSASTLGTLLIRMDVTRAAS